MKPAAKATAGSARLIRLRPRQGDEFGQSRPQLAKIISGTSPTIISRPFAPKPREADGPFDRLVNPTFSRSDQQRRFAPSGHVMQAAVDINRIAGHAGG